MDAGAWLRFALLLGLLLAACRGASESPSPALDSSAPETRAAGQRAAVAESPPSTAAPAAAATPPITPLPQKVTISYSSISGDFVPLFLAADHGFFTRYGLDADVTFISGGTTSMQSLIAGDVQFIATSGAEPVAAYLAGAPVQIVIAWSLGLPAVFMVDSSITSPEQLRGRTIGITRFGGQPHVGARLALKHWGLDPENDVQYLQLGGVAEILGAMQQGMVVGGVFSPPTYLRAQALGFRALADVGQLPIPYQSDILVGQQPYIDANPEVVRRLMQAMLEGLKLSLTDDNLALASIAKYTRVDEPDLLRETLDYFRRIARREPYPVPAGLQTLLDLEAERNSRAREVRPEEIINARALEQLDREGFLQRLWAE